MDIDRARSTSEGTRVALHRRGFDARIMGTIALQLDDAAWIQWDGQDHLVRLRHCDFEPICTAHEYLGARASVAFEERYKCWGCGVHRETCFCEVPCDECGRTQSEVVSDLRHQAVTCEVAHAAMKIVQQFGFIPHDLDLGQSANLADPRTLAIVLQKSLHKIVEPNRKREWRKDMQQRFAGISPDVIENMMVEPGDLEEDPHAQD